MLLSAGSRGAREARPGARRASGDGWRLLQLAVNIAVLTAIYALIACGYVLIYRVSRVLNLAHGELMMLGAYLVLATASLFNGHPGLALAAALALSLLVGALIYLFLL